MYHCTPIKFIPITMNKEILLDVREKGIIKISLENYIEFVDDYFLDLLGYQLTDFVTKPPKTVCHPDMPDIVHQTIGGYIMNRREGIAVLKHATREGDYIWAFTYYMPRYKPDGSFEAFVTYRKPIPDKKINGQAESLKNTITRLYVILKDLEIHSGVEVASKYLNGFLEDRGLKSLDEYYLQFFNFNKSELEKYFTIDERTSNSVIRKYLSGF